MDAQMLQVHLRYGGCSLMFAWREPCFDSSVDVHPWFFMLCLQPVWTPFFSEISAGGQSSSCQEDLASQAKNSSGSFFGEEVPWLLHGAIGCGRFQSEWVKMDEQWKVDGMMLWNRIWMEFGWNLNVGTCVCVCVFEELGPVIYDHIITRSSGEYPDRPLWWCLYGPRRGVWFFAKDSKTWK